MSDFFEIIIRESLVKDCNVKGPEICRTYYESECWTKQKEHKQMEDVPTCATVYEEICRDEVIYTSLRSNKQISNRSTDILKVTNVQKYHGKSAV